MKRGLLLAYGLISTVAIFLSMWFLVDIKFSAILSLINLLFLGHLMYKEKIDKEILVAIFFALIITSYYTYQYTSANYYIGKINLFPLIAWTTGLVFTRQIYKIFKEKNEKFAMYLLTILYLTVLFIVEYIGYNIFKIQLNSSYPDLLGLGILHGPIGMKAFYLSAGPVYVMITEYLLGNKKNKN